MKRKLLDKTKFLLMVALTFFSLTSMAQVLVQIGTGTGSVTNQGATPYGTYYHDGKVTYLITKAELNALNVFAGKFGSLAFNVVTAPGQALGGFTIKMAHTNVTSLSGYVTAPFTTVYSSPSVTATAGWNTYTFTNQFNYNNIDNVVIEVCFDNTSYTTNGAVQSSTTTFNSVYGTYMDGGIGCGAAPLSFVTAANNNRPNMRINYFPNVSGNNIGVMSIDSPTTFCSNIQNVYATVGNFGVNQVTGFNVNWSVNGVLQTPVASTASLDTVGGVNPNSLQLFLGSYNFPSGNSSLVKVWTSDPNFQTDTVRDNDTATAVKNLSMGGLYTIGATGNYPTINAAVADLKLKGVCAPVYFTVAPGTYNGQVVIDGPITGASNVNTITFDGVNRANRILAHNWSTGDYATLVIKNSFVIVRNFTINSTNTNTGYGVSIVNSSYVKIINCNITVPNQQSTACIPISISGSGTSYSTATKSDFVEIDSCITNYGYFGIVHYSSTNSSVGMKITNTRINDHRYYGIYSYYNKNNTIDNNYIQGSSLNQTGYGIYALQLNHDTTYGLNSISNNQIIRTGYYGIFLSTATNIIGYKGRMVNNMVGGHLINTAYYGLYMTNCTNWSIAHNTFYNDIPNATITYAAAYFTGGSNLSVVNNIFARRNTSTNTTFYGSSSTIFDTLNYNVFYRQDTTANFAYLGAYYTPSNLKGVGGHNLNSIFANPMFVNDTNLIVNNSCLAGTPLPFVTTDYFGTTRSATAPTIGADEFIKQTEDLAIEAITAPTTPVTAGIQDMTVRIKNQGTNTVTSFNVSYTNNGGTPVVYNWTGSLAACDTVSVTFTGANQINISAIHNIVVYTSAPNNLVDLNRNNDTLKTQILLPLNGTYTVGGATANFTDPAQAAVALKAAGITGPVVFNINPGTYNGQVLVEGPITGLNDINTVTFEGNNAANRIINANVSQAAFLIRNTNYIKVRNLTINNTAPSGATGIAVVGTTTNTIGSGCSIVGNTVNLPNLGFNTGYGIIATGTTNGSGVSNNWIDSLTVDSNTVNGGYHGISIYGNTTSPSTLRNRGHKVRYNTLNNATFYGIQVYYVYNAVDVIGNNISMVSATPSSVNYGLYFYYNQNTAGTTPHRIIGNKVINANYMGLYLYYFASPSGVPMQMYNNVVSGTARYSTSYGMYCYTAAATANVNIYHNTILADNAAGGTAYGVYYYNTTGTIQNIRNNIFGVSTNTAGTAYPFYFNNSAAALNVNFNNYYNLSSTNLVYRNAVNYTSANYKSAAAGGDSSFNYTPSFTSLINPTLTEGCIRGFNLSAVVPTDIVGNTRSITPNLGAYEFAGVSNDLAIEALIAPVAPITLGAQNLVVRVKNVGTSTVSSFNLSHRINNGTPNVYNWTGTLAACDTITITLSGANQITLGNTTNNVKVYTSNPNASADLNRNNDTVSVTLLPPMSGNYVIGATPSDYVSFTDAVNAMGARGIAGPVTFNVKTGTYNESLTLNSVIGASATNTIRFKSQANHVDSAVLSWNGNTGNNYTIRFNSNANHYIFDRLTIEQTANSITAYGITLASTASFDTIRNCKLNMPTNISYASYSIYTTGYTGTGLCIDNNIIDGSYYGAYIYGASRTTPMKNVVVNGNTFNNFYYSSLYYFYYSTDSRVSNNTFNVPTTSSTTMYSYLRYNDSAFKFTNNIYNGLSGKTQYMYLDYSQNSPANRSLIANNQVKGDGNMYFYVANTSSNNQDVVHNSFNLGTGYFYLYPNSLSNYRVMNNVFNASGTYAYYFSAAPNAASLTSDYNLVNVPGTTPYYATAARTLPAMRTVYAGLEGNSIHYRAAYTSPTNLIPNAADTAVWAINGRGNHLGYVLNDVNNVARPQTPAAGVPDLGAFEVTPTAIAPLATAVPATPVAGGTQVFLFGTDTVAKITYDASTTVPAAVGVRQYTGVRHPQVGVTQNYTNVYADITATGNGGYLFDASLYYTNPQLGTNPNESNLRMARFGNPLWVNYTGTASFVDTINNYIKATSLNDFNTIIGTDDLNPLPACPAASATASSSTTLCTGGSVVLNSSTGIGFTYQWLNNNTPIASATNQSYTAISSGNYRVVITSGACLDTSSAISVTVNAIPTITSSTPASRCGTGTVNLTAAASTGTINWYSAATGGTSLGTGTSFSTPSISTTTTYYVDATANGCTSAARTAVAATVNAIPTITSSTPASRCGTGTVSLTAAASAGTINWYAAATGGTSLATGTSFTTPSISATTTYYVDAIANGCTATARTSVEATVNALPTATATAAGSTNLCTGGSVIINANTGTGLTYQWLNNNAPIASATNAAYTANATGSYRVLVNNGSCSDTSTAVAIVVNAIPTITSSTPASRCGTGTVSLTAAASAGTINWYSAATGGTSLATGTSFTTPSISATTTYYVDATTNGCTTATRTAVTATVNALPTATATAASVTTFCTGGSVVINANTGAGLTYQWLNNNAPIAAATNAAYTANAAGSYRVLVTNANSCKDTSTAVTVVVNAIPTITSSTPASRCGTGTVSLTAAASAGTINWYAAATGGTSLGTGTNFTTPSISSTTTYYVDATANGCTTATRTAVTATVNTIPTITSSTPASRCGTGTVSLTAAASAGTINWYTAATGGTSLATGTSFTTPSISATTTYYVDATANGCTTATRTAVAATVNAIPTITSSTPASRCGTGTVSLAAAASAGTINWYASATGGTSLATGTNYTTPSISATTTYYVDATANGCTTATRTAVAATVNPNLTASVSVSSNTTSICGSTPITFTATPTNGGTTPSYQWKKNGVNVGTNSDTYVLNNALNADSVYVVMTSNATPCLVNTTANSNGIKLTSSTVTPTVAVTANPGNVICNGTSVTFTANATNGGSTPAYQWKRNGVNVGTNASTFVTSLLSTNDSISVVLTSNASCLSTSTATSLPVVMTVNAIPTISSSTPASRCGTGTVSLTAAASAGTINWYSAATGGTSLATGTSFTTPSISATTTYYVDATANGCTTATRTAVSATVNALPTATATAAGSTSLCTGGSVVINANTGTGLTYQWLNNNAPIASATNAAYTANAAGSYRVLVTNANSCKDTSTAVAVVVNAIPTITSSTPASRCGTGTVSLTAAASAGTINWYAAATGGTSLATGTTYTTPSISATTTYYVDATANGCTTASRTSIAATVNAKPLTSAISGRTTVHSDTVETYAVTNTTGSSYVWTVIGGAKLTGGTTNSITVDWDVAYTAGMVKVVETNTLGCQGDTVFKPIVSIVPVEFLSFDAKRINDKVNLTWVTASEINNSHFEVERSMDNNKFENIGTVKGNGTTSMMNTYKLTDNISKLMNSNATTLYYRLKQVDYDGEFAYTDVRTVELNKLDAVELTVYPNPNYGEFNLSVRSTESTSTTFVIFNNLGAEVWSYTTTLNEGLNTIPVQLQLAKGMYNVNMISEKGTQTQRFVVK